MEPIVGHLLTLTNHLPQLCTESNVVSDEFSIEQFVAGETCTDLNIKQCLKQLVNLIIRVLTTELHFNGDSISQLF